MELELRSHWDFRGISQSQLPNVEAYTLTHP
jgi:hypothetical protein